MNPFTALWLLVLTATPFDILRLEGAPLGSGGPPDWKVRVVRGQTQPDLEVRNDGGNKGTLALLWENTEASIPFTVLK